MRRLGTWLKGHIINWLTKERAPTQGALSDFSRLRLEVRPGDVILVEGRSRTSDVIKMVTQSPWTHSMIYLGRRREIHDPEARRWIERHHKGPADDQLILEALLGKGTIVQSLETYSNDHLRICRPKGLSDGDAQHIVRYCAQRLGTDYDIRQLLDLARFFVPWGILPRRWRSSLFHHNAGEATRTVCSSLIAEAFNSVDFPILPFIDRRDDGTLQFFKRNPKLFTPRDFDYSPYFEIIKYPFLGLDDVGLYRKLPWMRNATVYNDDGDDFLPEIPKSNEDTDEALDDSLVVPAEAAERSAR